MEVVGSRLHATAGGLLHAAASCSELLFCHIRMQAWRSTAALTAAAGTLHRALARCCMQSRIGGRGMALQLLAWRDFGSIEMNGSSPEPRARYAKLTCQRQRGASAHKAAAGQVSTKTWRGALAG